ncbi:MAG: hypothetical protein V3W19_16355 [Desulfatiglandales bacterium]
MPFLKCLAGGLRHFRVLRNGGPPGFPIHRIGKNSGGGRPHPSVTPRNDQAGSLGIEEKASPPSDRVLFQVLGNSLCDLTPRKETEVQISW